MSAPKSGKYSATYAAFEPVPFRPAGYTFPFMGEPVVANDVFAAAGTLKVNSTAWDKPAEITLPKKANAIMGGGAKILNAFQNGFYASGVSAWYAFNPTKKDKLQIVCKSLEGPTIDYIAQMIITASGQTVDFVIKFGKDHLGELRTLAGDPTMAPPAKWKESIYTTDPRVASLAPNALDEKEAVAYAKLPQTYTSWAFMDPTSKYMISVTISIDSDQVHYSAKLNFYKTASKQAATATLLKSFDITQELPDRFPVSYISFWQRKQQNKNPLIVNASMIHSISNNMIGSAPWNDPFYILNRLNEFNFGEDKEPLIPMQWIFGVYLRKQNTKQQPRRRR